MAKTYLATLDADGKIPSSQLPSYVDDVLEYSSKDSFPTKGEASKIYVDTTANLTYRWSGSKYVEISPSLALGETSSTAYRGDRGKVAYEHSQTAHAPSNAQQNVQSDWNATSGDSFIKNKPTIPTKVGELTNDKDYATKTDVSNAIDDIEIGGRNLIIGSATCNLAMYSAGGIFETSYLDDETVPTKKIISIKCTDSGFGFFSAPYHCKSGETYTYSFYAKCSVNKSNCGYGIGFENGGMINIELTTEWKKYTHTFTANSVDHDGLVWYLDWNVNEELFIHSLKLENGNKATPWTPAPEDTEAEIRSVDNKLTTNMLKPTLETITKDGVTCTNNGDGTFTLDGNSTGTSILVLGNVYFESGKIYRLVGWNNSIVGIQDELGIFVSKIFRFDLGDGTTFTVKTSGFYDIDIVYKSGNTFDNFVIKPMITTNLNATYDDFVPYTGSTGQLNSDVAEVRKDVDEHTHEIADVTGLQSALSGKQNILNGTVSVVDWNTLVKPGSYKIQQSTMTSDYHAPVGEYGFGILFVIDSEGTNNEHRLMQLYFPHQPRENFIWFRMNNSRSGYDSWTEWNGISRDADTLDGNHASAFATASHTHSNYLTGITKDMVTTALGYTPPTTDTWRPLGTTADTACAGNDSRLSNARPASDVYDWAKASSKPSYSYSEISGTPSSLPANGGTSTYADKLTTSAGSATKPVYFSNGIPVECTNFREWKCLYTDTPKTAMSISSIVQGDYKEMIVEVEIFQGDIWSAYQVSVPIDAVSSLTSYKSWLSGYSAGTSYYGVAEIRIKKDYIFLITVYKGGVNLINDKNTHMRVYYR